MSKEEIRDDCRVAGGMSALVPVILYSGSGSVAGAFGMKRPAVSLFCPKCLVFASIAVCRVPKVA